MGIAEIVTMALAGTAWLYELEPELVGRLAAVAYTRRYWIGAVVVASAIGLILTRRRRGRRTASATAARPSR